jgi:hypothetical protein
VLITWSNFSVTVLQAALLPHSSTSSLGSRASRRKRWDRSGLIDGYEAKCCSMVSTAVCSVGGRLGLWCMGEVAVKRGRCEMRSTTFSKYGTCQPVVCPSTSAFGHRLCPPPLPCPTGRLHVYASRSCCQLQRWFTPAICFDHHLFLRQRQHNSCSFCFLPHAHACVSICTR